jgi:hypothetical protein
VVDVVAVSARVVLVFDRVVVVVTCWSSVRHRSERCLPRGL